MANASKKSSRKNSPVTPNSAGKKIAKTRSAEPRATIRAQSAKQKSARILSSKLVYKARVFQVTSDEVIEPSGVKARRDIIRHPGSVVVLAIDEQKSEPSVLLIRQFRYAANQELWELPAGRIDEGEDALAAAKRELAEETGYSAAEWKPALYYYASPGFLTETMSLFAARDLRKGKAAPEEDEVITCKLVPLAKAVQWVMSGKIHDGKAIAGVLWAAQKFHICGNGR